MSDRFNPEEFASFLRSIYVVPTWSKNHNKLIEMFKTLAAERDEARETVKTSPGNTAALLQQRDAAMSAERVSRGLLEEARAEVERLKARNLKQAHEIMVIAGKAEQARNALATARAEALEEARYIFDNWTRDGFDVSKGTLRNGVFMAIDRALADTKEGAVCTYCGEPIGHKPYNTKCQACWHREHGATRDTKEREP